jgi:hypothetical protein
MNVAVQAASIACRVPEKTLYKTTSWTSVEKKMKIIYFPSAIKELFAEYLKKPPQKPLCKVFFLNTRQKVVCQVIVGWHSENPLTLNIYGVFVVPPQRALGKNRPANSPFAETVCREFCIAVCQI